MKYFCNTYHIYCFCFILLSAIVVSDMPDSVTVVNFLVHRGWFCSNASSRARRNDYRTVSLSALPSEVSGLHVMFVETAWNPPRENCNTMSHFPDICRSIQNCLSTRSENLMLNLLCESQLEETGFITVWFEIFVFQDAFPAVELSGQPGTGCSFNPF